MKNNVKKGGRKTVLLRLIRMLFSFYPVLLPVTLLCILLNAVISSIPSIFMQNVIAAVEQSWQTGDWRAFPAIFSASSPFWLFSTG